MPDILFVDADFDEVTRYCCIFRTAFVISQVPAHYRDHLYQHDATQPNVDHHIASNNYKYLSGAGHGLYRMFRGHNNCEIWKASDDLSHLKGLIVHLLSCQTGASLGRSMVKQGVRAFWGYEEDFVFVKLKQPPIDLLQDQSAGFVLRMDCLIDEGILTGKDANEIYDMVDDYVANLISQAKPHVRSALVSNYQNLVCPITTWGDPKATI